MDTARPLRDVFTDLVGSQSGVGSAEILRASGHPDLPDGLLAEAVCVYADTAPIEVAEHLSQYVIAHAAVPLIDAQRVEPADWFDTIVTAPAPTEVDPLASGLDGTQPGDVDGGWGRSAVDQVEDGSDRPGAGDHEVGDHAIGTGVDGLDFGHGGTSAGAESSHAWDGVDRFEAWRADDASVPDVDLDDLDEPTSPLDAGPNPEAGEPGGDDSGWHDVGDHPSLT